MTRAADIRIEIQAMEIRTSLLGKRCWEVGCGGSAGYTFWLHLGKKLLQCPPPNNPSAAEKYRRLVGEFSLHVWCSWTLQDHSGPVTSSDDETDGLEKGLQRLAGQSVRSVEISSDWILKLGFSGGLFLTAFPDHVGPSASFDGNWELWRQYDAYIIGTDLRCEVIQRDYPPLAPPAGRQRWSVQPKKRINRTHRKVKSQAAEA